MKMKHIFKMEDVFELPLKFEQFDFGEFDILDHEGESITRDGYNIQTKTAEAIVHAVNSHDEAMEVLSKIEKDGLLPPARTEMFKNGKYETPCEVCNTAKNMAHKFLSTHNDSEGNDDSKI